MTETKSFARWMTFGALAILLLWITPMVHCQTVNYPGSLDTDATLFVAKDNIQTKLTSPMLIGDTVAIVASTTGWVANMIASADSEQLFVTSVSGANVLNVTRAFAGTTAAGHATGAAVSNFIDAAYQKVLKLATIAIETALGANLSNIPGSPSGGTVPINKGGTGQVTASAALTALLAGRVQGQTPNNVFTCTGAFTTGHVVMTDANGNCVDGGVGPSVTPTGTGSFQDFLASAVTPFSGIFRNRPWAYAPDFDFAAQTIGGTVTAGSTIVAGLTPCPPGVNGTDLNHYLYVSGGTGTAEAVLISQTGGAGSCASGAASGTVKFVIANNHSGSWTVSSATTGGAEGVQYLFSTYVGGMLAVSPQTAMTMHQAITFPAAGFTVFGFGAATSTITRAEDYPNGDLLLFNNTGNCCSKYDVQNIVFNNHTTAAQTTGGAIHIIVAQVNMDHIYNSSGGPHTVIFDGAGDSKLTNFRFIPQDNHAIDAILLTAASGATNTDIVISNGQIFGLSTTLAIDDQSADGLNITNVVGGNAGTFLRIQPGAPNQPTVWYNANTIVDGLLIDTCKPGDATVGTAIRISSVAGSGPGGIRISNSTIDGCATGILTTTTGGGALGGPFEFVNNQLGGQYNSAIQINAASGLTTILSGNHISGCNASSTASAPCVLINGGNVNITGGAIQSSTATWGIGSEGASTYVGIVGVDLGQGGPFVTGPVSLDMGFTTTPTHIVMHGNLGIDEVIPAVASAATFALPYNPNFTITGTTAITALSAAPFLCWSGRSGQFTTTGGAVPFSSGATIGNSFTTRQNVPVAYYCDGTKIWLTGLPTYLNPTVGANVASAGTITPTGSVFHVTGTAAIATINLPTGFTAGCLTLIPDGAFTTTNAGNIAIASTGVLSKAMTQCYDPGTSKFYPSY